MSDPRNEPNTEVCECPKCGRVHKHLQAGTPPASISDERDRLRAIRDELVAALWEIERKGTTTVRIASAALALAKAKGGGVGTERELDDGKPF